MVPMPSKPSTVHISDSIMITDELQQYRGQRGLSYVEVLVTVSMTAVIVLALMGVVNTATETGNEVAERNTLTREARFALSRMSSMLGRSPTLLLPLADNPATNWPENLREQTDPPTPPLGSSTLATAVLAFSLPAYVDLDGDDLADADNDGDGRIDEDLPGDATWDNASGIVGIDDNGDGTVDEGDEKDDDEDGDKDEDWFNGVDDDGDGRIDEDPKDDNNKDDKAGVAGIDDDADGDVDEGDKKDDDEDGVKDEDWYDPVVFYLKTGSNGRLALVERSPVPWDVNSDTVIDGLDFVESELAQNVTHFRVERLQTATSVVLIDITIGLVDPQSGESISLQTRVRAGGAL